MCGCFGFCRQDLLLCLMVMFRENEMRLHKTKNTRRGGYITQPRRNQTVTASGKNDVYVCGCLVPAAPAYPAKATHRQQGTLHPRHGLMSSSSSSSSSLPVPTTRSRTLLFISYRDSRASSSRFKRRVLFSYDESNPDGDEQDRLIEPDPGHVSIDAELPPQWYVLGSPPQYMRISSIPDLSFSGWIWLPRLRRS